MVEMIAAVDLKKRGVKAGASFETDARNARLLKALRRADYAPARQVLQGASLLPDDGSEQAQPENARSRRKYQRRDMQAEG